MPAFSHYTYHASGGKELVCDLQGVKRSNRYVLTDPVICSLREDYGLTDMGEAGIQAFFANHKCTEICQNWRKHSNPKKTISTVQGTTFRLR